MRESNRRILEHVVREMRAVKVGVAKFALDRYADGLQKVLDDERERETPGSGSGRRGP